MRRAAGALLAGHVDPRGGAAGWRTPARRRSWSTSATATLGIMTDRDLRSRVVAAGVDPARPVVEVMSAPAYTVAADRLGGEVAAGHARPRHPPLPRRLADGSASIGVVEDADLVAVATRSSFHLRAAIARAATARRVAGATAGLRPARVALHDARVAATDIAAIQSVVVDAVDPPAARADGGRARRPAGAVRVDRARQRRAPRGGAVVGHRQRARVVRRRRRPAAAAGAAGDRRARDGRARGAAGFRADPKGAVASKPLFARSHGAWRAAAHSWLENPTQEKALILVSLVVDGRPVWGDPHRSAGAGRVPRRPAQARSCCACSRGSRSRTGRPPASCAAWSSRTRASTAAGSTSSTAGIVPIADLARWAGLAAGVTHASTPARLRAAAEAGTLESRGRAAARGGLRADRRAAARPPGRAAEGRRASRTTSSIRAR